ncbi:MAG: 50S ribosomal protein L23 [Nitrospiraceae bacterium]|nr:50S ribosomal protein L23 [Nitrospiraceae bacterium]
MKSSYDVIIRPIITEKGVGLSNMEVKPSKSKEARKISKLVLEVKKDASKTEIKDAVKRVLGVDVEKVNTAVVKGKRKSVRFLRGKKKDTKKAIVTLKQGQSVDLEKI